MLYSDYMVKAKELTIEKADNGLFYLEPEWRSILLDNKMNLKTISDMKYTWSDIEDVLKLEVEKRNVTNSVKPYVFNWLNEIITSTVDPAMVQEEIDLMKVFMDQSKNDQ